MPVLNEADTIYYNGQRIDRIYAGTTLVWPEIETWSNWMLVGASPVAGPAAWFSSLMTHYDTGAHHQVAWRYSNHGRIRYHGLARTLAVMSYDNIAITCNLDPVASGVPYPVFPQMGFGLASQDITATWIGAPVRWDAVADATYHHTIRSRYLNSGVTLPSGSWISFDCTFTFGGET